MNTSVARLIRRLLPVFASAAVAPQSKAVVSLPPSHNDQMGNEPVILRQEELKTNKLIFGTARAGNPQLLAHGSHSSHSSHSSHYSGSSGRGSYTPPAQTPPPPQETPTKVAPKPEKQPPSAADTAPEMANVLKKLPRVRSKWPKEAKLTKATQFNLYDGNSVVGVISLNAGTRIKIIEITLAHAVVRIGSTESPLPVNSTDIIALMGGAPTILALPDDSPAETESKPATKN
ncbi:MAG: hypothetical protein ABI273_10040 [Lacunisphaera sp.]